MKKDNSNALHLSSSDFVPVAPRQVWKVLTDYQHLADFIPNLLSTTVVSRTGNSAILEQHGRAGVLFVTRDIRMIVRATEKPMSAIDIELVSGDMKQYDAHWKIRASKRNGIAGTRIDYSASMEPDFFVPGMISTPLVEEGVRAMTQALLAEIVRRAAL